MHGQKRAKTLAVFSRKVPAGESLIYYLGKSLRGKREREKGKGKGEGSCWLQVIRETVT